MKQKKAFIMGLVWLAVIVSIIGSGFSMLTHGEYGGINFLTNRKEREMLSRYARLDEVRTMLIEDYYLEVDEEKLMEGAVRGMMAALQDPYTFYYSPEEMSMHEKETGESYNGIGMQVQNNMEGYIEVIRVHKEGPADAAGIRIGDYIVSVNNAPVSGKNAETLREAIKLLTNITEKSIKIVVQRDGERIPFELVPGKVSVSNIAWEMLAGDVGYINILQFEGNAAEGFENALEQLEKNGAKYLVVDVRNNPGGLLEDVVHIADLLLEKGLVVYIEDRNGEREEYNSDKKCCDLPLVILVNENSASASEILAAAIQEHDRGKIIGTNTYGKGVVQTMVTFDADGAGMQYTSAVYYTPNGNSIHELGISPDIVINADESFRLYPEKANLLDDLQLQKAVEYLKSA